MKIVKPLSTVVLLCAATVSYANPEYLGSFDLNATSESDSVPNALYLSLGYGAPGVSCNGGAGYSIIGCEKSWSPGETGSFDFNSRNAPKFDEVAGKLTNGVDETVWRGYWHSPLPTSGAQGSSDIQPPLENATVSFIRLLLTHNSSTITEPVVEVQDAVPVALLRGAVPAQDATEVGQVANWQGNVRAEWQVWGNKAGGGGNQVPEISVAGMPVALGLLVALLMWRRDCQN